jgi:hypothetical protein
MIFALAKQFSDDKGRSPKWMAALSAMVFKGMWICYDGVFKNVFGDGERTVGDAAMATGTRMRNEDRVRDAEKEALLKETVSYMTMKTDTRKGGMKGLGDYV